MAYLQLQSNHSGSVCLCCGFTAQSTQWGHVKRGHFPHHFYWAGLVLLAVNQYWAHSFARNWQVSVLTQQKGENDHRKYFMIKSPRNNVADPAGVEPTTAWSPVRCSPNWATKADEAQWLDHQHISDENKSWGLKRRTRHKWVGDMLLMTYNRTSIAQTPMARLPWLI